MNQLKVHTKYDGFFYVETLRVSIFITIFSPTFGIEINKNEQTRFCFFLWNMSNRNKVQLQNGIKQWTMMTMPVIFG